MCAVCVLVNLGGQNPGDPTELKMVMSCHVGVGNLTLSSSLQKALHEFLGLNSDRNACIASTSQTELALLTLPV